MPDKRQPDSWLQYSGIGIQMAVTIIVCWWFGEKLESSVGVAAIEIAAEGRIATPVRYDARSTAKRLLAARLRAEALRRKAPAQNTEAAYAGGFDPGSQGEAAPTRAPAPRPAPAQPSPESSSDDDDDDGCEWERGETADGLGVAADGDASAVDVEALIALPPAVR